MACSALWCAQCRLLLLVCLTCTTEGNAVVRDGRNQTADLHVKSFVLSICFISTPDDTPPSSHLIRKVSLRGDPSCYSITCSVFLAGKRCSSPL